MNLDDATTATGALPLQWAPFPHPLLELLAHLRYKPGWQFRLYDNYLRDPADTHGVEGRGLTLSILIDTPDSYDPERRIYVQHLFIVPAATYNAGSWRRWLLDCVLRVEQHECCEFFRLHIADDPVEYERPFAPLHGPGEDPYRIVEYASEQQRRTSFRGELNPS